MLDSLFRDDAMQAVFADTAGVQRMLDFEAALARAEGRCGVIPAAAATPIGNACAVAAFDLRALAELARDAGNIAIPLVKALTTRVAAADREAARWVHWGATSQDVIDTARVLQLRAGLDLLERSLTTLSDTLAGIVRAHRDTVMAGRTWLQQAVPITFGLKAAGWLDGLLRDRGRLRESRKRLLVLQFGGAAGNLASLGSRGLEVAEQLAIELELGLPALPWHAQRDRIAEAGAIVGLAAGTLGKLARDLSLLAQTEVAEVFEPAGEGRGGSSTMPYKRNPVGCAVALAAAVRVPGLVATLYSAMPQEHERGLGNWPAEWETLPEIFELTAGSLAAMTRVVQGLDVDAVRMRANLDITHGLIHAERVSFRLAESLGRQAAHELVARACHVAQSRGRSLQAVLGADPEVVKILGPLELEQLFDPQAALGASHDFIDRVLAALKD
jgi:3-carboxy-cis,cis-muconate cycloisomerase